MNNNNNLRNHNFVDTFYMTDEQIKTAKKIAKENGTLKHVAKFFIGAALTVLAVPVATYAVVPISSSVLAALVGNSIILAPAVFGMSNFFKIFKTGENVRSELYGSGSKENKEENEKTR